jgi:hypothetical protein
MAHGDLDNGGFNHIVFNPNNKPERRSWKFFNYTVARSLTVFVTRVLIAFFMVVFKQLVTNADGTYFKFPRL